MSVRLPSAVLGILAVRHYVFFRAVRRFDYQGFQARVFDVNVIEQPCETILHISCVNKIVVSIPDMHVDRGTSKDMSCVM